MVTVFFKEILPVFFKAYLVLFFSLKLQDFNLFYVVGVFLQPLLPENSRKPWFSEYFRGYSIGILFDRSSHWRCSVRKDVPRKFCRIQKKIPVREACNSRKKKTLAQVFFCEFWEIFKNTSFYIATPTAASVRTSSQWNDRN